MVTLPAPADLALNESDPRFTKFPDLTHLEGVFEGERPKLRLGDTSADTPREAAEEWIEEEQEWQRDVETPQCEEPPDGLQVITGADDDEDWDNGFNRSAHKDF
ncbi:hypothetical protein NDU88_005419 [Pleurodeles waltl]|uniref:Uncharacterized protein n=1 Tax=Pleurodeles waltl TaxID=8319 RepID=A0AAV7NQB9_PLEWA|nr:hypothetical protein NDU88_005419 [Pleurodeles waltl]